VAVAADLGASDPTAGEDASRQAERSLANLLSTFHRLKSNLRGRAVRFGGASNNERRAVDAAMLLTGLGLLLAVAAALLVLRTLWPLRVLREHARQIAGGDYARRTGVRRATRSATWRASSTPWPTPSRNASTSSFAPSVWPPWSMAAHITHEIRNPLASVGLYLNCFPTRSGGQARGAQSGQVAVQRSRSAERDHGNYLRFVRLPKPKLDREDLGALASSVMEFSRGELSLATSIWTWPSLLAYPRWRPTRSDPAGLAQSGPQRQGGHARGGRIRVEVGMVDSGWVRLAVGDSGSGISRRTGKIFRSLLLHQGKGHRLRPGPGANRS